MQWCERAAERGRSKVLLLERVGHGYEVRRVLLGLPINGHA